LPGWRSSVPGAGAAAEVEPAARQPCSSRVTPLRIAILCATAGFAYAAGATASTAPSTSGRTVPCGESIDMTKFPYVGSSRPQYRYRLVLGAASVPPGYLAQVVPTGEMPWAYWRKAGLIVRAGGPAVSISVPPAWRARAGIAWGYGNKGVFDTLRIASCPGPPGRGLAFSGGFYLHSPSACVPLVFRVGRRSETVRFGIGRRCRG
jgi:hypothetical protein